MKWAITLFLVIFLSGCGIIPKSVEFGQKKVREFPSHTGAQREAEKQAVALAADKARQAEKLAQIEGSSAEEPAAEAAELSEAVGRSLGPPLNPWVKEPEALKTRLDTLTAKYDRLLDRFADRNDEMAGKKVEGTGFFQVPYFLWLGIVIVGLFSLWIILKTVANVAATANPGVAVGLNVAKAGGRVISKGFSQLLSGGEKFKEWVKSEVKDNPELQEKILNQFRTSHEKAQDKDIQALVKKLTHGE
jgi:hypothetical protein